MKILFTISFFFLSSNLIFSQQENSKFNLQPLQPKKYSFFEPKSIVKENLSNKVQSFNFKKSENKSHKNLMPIFEPKGNFAVRSFLIDTIQNYSLEIVAPKFKI